MRRFASTISALLLASLAAGAVRAADEEVDAGATTPHRHRAVATVNGHVIQYGEVVDRLGAALRTLANPDPKVRRDLERTKIVELITDRLILDAAKKLRLSIPARFLDEQVARERERIERSGTRFDDYLAEAGMSLADLRSLVENQVTRDQFLLGQLGLRTSQLGALDRPEYDIGVSPRDAREWFERHAEDFKLPADVRLRTITFAVSEYLSLGGGVTTDEAVAKARAAFEDAGRRLAEGVRFEELAREVSQDLYREQGGDNGRRELSSLHPTLRAAVADTPVGGVGEATIRSMTGSGKIVQFVVFRVDERRDERVSPFDDPETQKRVFDTLRSEKLLRAEAKIVADLARKAIITPERYRALVLEVFAPDRAAR